MGQDWQYLIPFYGSAKLGVDVGKGVSGMWKGDQGRLSDIEQKIEESGKSPYNTMQAQTIPVTQELKDYYQKMKTAYADAMYQAKQGMTPAETAAYQTQFNQQQNLAAQTAQMAGGGGAGAYINSVLGGQAGKFNVEMAAQNQAIKRQNQQLAYSYLQGLGGAAGQMQDIGTRQAMLNQEAFAKNFEKQMLVEQALGQAKQDWYANRDANRQALISTYANLLGSALGGAAGGGGGGLPKMSEGAGGISKPFGDVSPMPSRPYTPMPTNYRGLGNMPMGLPYNPDTIG